MASTLTWATAAFAMGIKVANPGFGSYQRRRRRRRFKHRSGHFVSAGRRNLDITYLIYDNGVYGLTKGQASPTLQLGMQTKALPKPNINAAVNPVFFCHGFRLHLRCKVIRF